MKITAPAVEIPDKFPYPNAPNTTVEGSFLKKEKTFEKLAPRNSPLRSPLLRQNLCFGYSDSALFNLNSYRKNNLADLSFPLCDVDKPGVSIIIRAIVRFNPSPVVEQDMFRKGSTSFTKRSENAQNRCP